MNIRLRQKYIVATILLFFSVVTFAEDTYTYVLVNQKNEVLYCGISNDLQRRDGEHKREGKIPYDHMSKTGGPMTEEQARQEEVACVCKYNPPYNQRPTCPYQLPYKTQDDKYSLE